MLMICILLAAIGMGAYLSRDEIFISGANLTISVVTLLLLPILQATQNRDEDEIERVRLDDGARIKLASVDGKTPRKG